MGMFSTTVPNIPMFLHIIAHELITISAYYSVSTGAEAYLGNSGGNCPKMTFTSERCEALAQPGSP